MNFLSILAGATGSSYPNAIALVPTNNSSLNCSIPTS